MPEFRFRVHTKVPTKGSYITVKRGGMCIAIDRNANELKRFDRLIRAEYEAIRPPEPLDEPVEVLFTFYIPMPKKPRFLLPASSPDYDKLARAVSDGIQANKRRKLPGLIADDGRIVDAVIRERFVLDHAEEGVEVIVRPFTNSIVF